MAVVRELRSQGNCGGSFHFVCWVERIIRLAIKLSRKACMSELENARPLGADPSPQPRTFDFFETLLVALITYAVFLFAAQLTIMLSLPAFMDGLSSEQYDILWKQPVRQGSAVILANSGCDRRTLGCDPASGQGIHRLFSSELAKPRRDRNCSWRHDNFLDGRSLRHDQTWNRATSNQFGSRSWRCNRIDDIRGDHLRCCSGPRGIRISWLYVSRVVSVVSGSDRCDRAYSRRYGRSAHASMVGMSVPGYSLTASCSVTFAFVPTRRG